MGDIMLEKKYENPIKMIVGNGKNVCVLDNEQLPLERGVMFGGEHYGFDITFLDGGEVISSGTQCKIDGVQIVGDNVTILEENKYIPWRINKNTGEIVNEAKFSFLKKTEMAYLRDNFDVTDEEGLARINGDAGIQL